MTKATYYVLAKTLWQNDKFSPVAGGFSDKEEAERVASEKASNGVNEYGQQNLKNVVETIVVSKTKMKKQYGWSVPDANEEIYRIVQNERWKEEMMQKENWS